MKRLSLLVPVAAVGLWSLAGCGHRSQPAPMAPPMAQSAPPMNGNMGGGMGGNMPVSNMQGGVYNWQDVPVDQQVGIQRAQFDQGGYQLITDSGDTIVVPFANQNLYVMKFGRTGGPSYFVNENGVPTLYLAQGFGLANANPGAQGAMWYPIPNDYNYSRPMYVGLAPSWNDYLGMGWYPGMTMYGGMWGYNPYGFHWMPNFYINIGGSRYSGWNSYHTYYNSHPGYYRPSVVYTNYNTARRGASSYRYTGSFGTGTTGSGSGGTGTTGSFTGSRPTSSTGSFNSSSRPMGSTGSFSTRSTGSTGSFSGGSRPTGSFNTGSGSGSFNSGTRATGSGSFNSPAPSGSSFSRPSGSSSFGNSGSGFSSRPARSSGSSFGGGSSFSRPSGGSSFGGGSMRSSGSFSRRR